METQLNVDSTRLHTGRSQCLMETQLNVHWPLPMLNVDSTRLHTGRSQCLMETELNVHWPLPILNGDSTQCTQAAPNA